MTRSRRRTRSRCSCPTCAASSRPTASRGCCTRSGERAASSAPRSLRALARAAARISAGFDRLPIRVRLAGVSAMLTFVILCAFAIAIGWITVHRIRADFNRQVTDTAKQLPVQLSIKLIPGSPLRVVIQPPLADFAAGPNDAVIRIFTLDERVVAQEPVKAPALGPPMLQARTIRGYRVLSVPAVVTENGEPIGRVIIE